MTKTIAYLRVSTDEQDLKKNKADILHLANEKNLGRVQWVEETVSGQVSWRKRKIAQVLESLQVGDNLLVSDLSRLGRSMLECMEILSIATDKKNPPLCAQRQLAIRWLDPIQDYRDGLLDGRRDRAGPLKSAH